MSRSALGLNSRVSFPSCSWVWAGGPRAVSWLSWTDLGGRGIDGAAHGGVFGEDVAVVVVDALDGDAGVGGDTVEGEVEGLRGAVVAGIDEVPGGDGEAAVGGFGDDEVLCVVGDAAVAELVEEAEVVVAGLVDAALGDEAELADEGLVDGATFFEDVVEGPEGHLVDVAVALADGVGERWADVGGVAGVVGADDVPLGPEEREVRAWVRRRSGRGLCATARQTRSSCGMFSCEPGKRFSTVSSA